MFFSNLLLIINCEIFSAIDELEKLAIDEGYIIEELSVLASRLDSNYVDR